MAGFVEKLRKQRKLEKLANEMRYQPFTPPNNPIGEGLASWGRDVRERVMNPENTLRGAIDRMKYQPAEEMAMDWANPVAGLAGLAGVVKSTKIAKPAKALSELPYQIQHKPMTVEGGASALHDLSSSFGEDIYGKHALEYFGSGDAREKAVLNTLRSVRGNPEAKVTIYRGLPADANGINAGDWVTLHPSVAQDYADLLAEQGKKGKVVKMEVPASSITSWPDSLLEFGYYPK